MTEPAHDIKPTPPVNLPDFKPKGMTTLDRCLAWTMAFILVITIIVFANKWIDNHNPNAAKPLPKATPTASATKVVPNTYFVVINEASGYIWWLDANGNHFTQSTATQFAHGHPTYKVIALKTG